MRLPKECEVAGRRPFGDKAKITRVIYKTVKASSNDFEVKDGVLVEYSGDGKVFSVPDGVEAIGNSAFDSSAVESVVLPKSLKTIGVNAFGGCANLKEIVIPDGVTSIGERAFDGCTSLTEIKIPAGVTAIEASAFCGCEGLKNVILPVTITSIGDHAFGFCEALKEITVPKAAKIHDFAFAECEVKIIGK